ncbi:pilus assembly protein N-terminal domain-containing protein [Maricaulis sp.]|uniref:pilus assembly protein N-terminal domain-containing protein n=1 Tax=Maricaulis sp. TaxID=1486257 RepID=UPI002614F074|nr:pilus assembly protein N-terminal domain-containing protein [Maricaulis sp.]
MIARLAALFTLAMIATTPAIAADEVVMTANHADIVRLPGEASAVVVGNPSIADAMVHDGRNLIITARLPGRTNIIALDRVGRILMSRELVVTTGTEGQVALFRGSERYTLNCGDVCEDVPMVGDEQARTNQLSDQQSDRLDVVSMAMGEDPNAPQ